MGSDEQGILHPQIAPKVNPNPLQKPGTDELLRRGTTGGPDDPGDRIFIADTKTLRHLLEVAQASPLGQAQIPRCGIQVDLHQRRDGSRYEVWRLVGGKPKPVPLPPIGEALLRGGTIIG